MIRLFLTILGLGISVHLAAEGASCLAALRTAWRDRNRVSIGLALVTLALNIGLGLWVLSTVQSLINDPYFSGL
jgi:zinc transporter ZupT